MTNICSFLFVCIYMIILKHDGCVASSCKCIVLNFIISFFSFLLFLASSLSVLYHHGNIHVFSTLSHPCVFVYVIPSSVTLAPCKYLISGSFCNFHHCLSVTFHLAFNLTSPTDFVSNFLLQ